METRILYLFTRTPLHVGSGGSIGAIDQPVQRERHTGFPIIPGSTLKGVFADEWTTIEEVEEEDPDKPGQKRTVRKARPTLERDWLFGREAGSGELTAGALQFGEARLLAFPVRSARGSFAWLTCPLMLRRAVQDGVLKMTESQLSSLLSGLTDETALFTRPSPLALGDAAKGFQIVLEEYTFKLAQAQTGTDSENSAATSDSELTLVELGKTLKALLNDLVWQEVVTRIVILSDGMMSFFATTACEIAQHVTIDDATGTAKHTGLFNQENVPSETLFYALIHALPESGRQLKDDQEQTRPAHPANAAVEKFRLKVKEMPVFQFGADASTGLGYCTVRLT